MTTPVTQATRGPIHWPLVAWMSFVHAGVLLAPFYFTWSGLIVCLSLYVLTCLGITLGYHRLLTHRSFRTPRFVKYLLTVFGSMAAEGSPIEWVATHRAHHQFSDRPGDPHSPRAGFWWSHIGWTMHAHPLLNKPEGRLHFAKDLARDPFHRFQEWFQGPLQLLVVAALFAVGHFCFDAGISWVVWGFFVRIVLTYHATWLVNSAGHTWGYQSYATGDQSRNLWWVALLSMGEGWHNNHHAFPRSAPHGLRWWEFDLTFLLIRALQWLRLARDVQLPPRKPLTPLLPKLRLSGIGAKVVPVNPHSAGVPEEARR